MELQNPREQPFLKEKIVLPTEHFGVALGGAQMEASVMTTADGTPVESRGNWHAFMAQKQRGGQPIPTETLWQMKTPADARELFVLLKDIGFNTVRIVPDGSRVVDENGRVLPAGVALYKEILAACNEAGLAVNLALCHRQLPEGLRWSDGSALAYWRTFVPVVLNLAGADTNVDSITTFVEPVNDLPAGYFVGSFPPYQKGWGNFWAAHRGMIEAHQWAVSYVQSQWRRAAERPDIIVSHGWMPIEADHFPVLDRLAAGGLHQWWNIDMIKPFLDGANVCLGVNAYAVIPFGLFSLFAKERQPWNWRSHTKPRPDAAATALIDARRAFSQAPLALTETGLGEPEETDDTRRPDHLLKILSRLGDLPKDVGELANILIWTAVDNVEWDLGKKERFGIIAYKGGLQLKQSAIRLKGRINTGLISLYQQMG